MKINFKRYFIILFLIFLQPGLILARHVYKEEATTIANSLITIHNEQNALSIQYMDEIYAANETLGYLFYLQPQGFIVVTAETDLPPVIAYSFDNNFGDNCVDNPMLKLIKTDIVFRENHLAENNNLLKNNSKWKHLLNSISAFQLDSTFQQWPAIGNGWIKTNWTQNAPYYNLCPMDPVTSQRSLAGCPAVAMAQIMNFHKTTNSTSFDDADDYYHNYAGRQYMIDDDHASNGFPSFPELDEFLDTLSLHYLNSVALTDTDKAALTYACGIAAKQVYTSSGSGTFSVSQALDAYLRFGCSTAVLLDSNDIDLFDRLKQNIKDTLPAHLAVVDSAWSSGHNVVVDGYNTNEYYHLNFGWGGSSNGWYLLPQEFPYNLTVIEGVVVDIMKPPPASVNESSTTSSICSVFPNPCNKNISISFLLKKNEDIKLKLYDVSGREIQSLVFTDEKPGVVILPIVLKEKQNGFYYFQIKAGDEIFIGKFISLQN
jgi:hypothetical protein